MDTPLATVVIPARNAANTVARAINSALEQPGTEVVVCDDGSSDATRARVAEIENARLTLVTHDEPRGPAAARNRAARAARAPVLVFLDADDELLPGSVGVRAVAFDAATGLVAGRVRVAGEGTLRFWPPADTPAAPTREDLLLANCVPTSGAAMRTDLFRELGGFRTDLRRCEDYHLWLRASVRAGVTLLPDIVAILHRGTKSTSSDARVMLEARRDMYRLLPLEVASADEIEAAVARTNWELEALG